MVLTPLASGANISNFSSGSSEVDILLNDATTYSDNVDGSVDLPLGESITSASMAVGSDPAVHGAHTRIDIETMPRVWNPNYNGQTTSFSKAEDFQFEDGSVSTPVSLKAEGILTDFESDMAGFMDATSPPLSSGAPWSHGSLFGGAILPANCASGDDCWGTGLYDNDYTDDNGNIAFKEVLNSPTLDLSSAGIKDPSVYFDSFHQLMTHATSGTSPSFRYPDCAYIEMRSSPTEFFDPSVSPWGHIDIDIQNSTGLSFGSGYYQVGNQVQTARSMADATVYRSTTMRSVEHPSLPLTRLDGPTSKLTFPITEATTSNFALSWNTTMSLLRAVIRFTTRPPCQDGTSTTSASEVPCHNQVGWVFVASCRMSKAAKTIQTATEFWPLKPRQPRRLSYPLMSSTP